MKFIKQFFTFLCKKFGPPPIESGQIWYDRDDISNPFKDPQEAKVLGYKNGWVICPNSK
jgi:hypothetical protein